MADKKFSPMRYTAATEESAVTGALQIVGATREEIEYEVLEQGAKGVTVRIKPRSADAPIAPLTDSAPEVAEETSPIAEDVPELLAQAEEFDQQEAEAAEALTGEIEAQTNGEMDMLMGDFTEETPDFDAQVAEENTQPVPSQMEEQVAAPMSELDPQIVARVQEMAQEFLDKMGLEAQALLDSPKESNSAALIIEGEDVGILIGKHGATLQAFQYLLNLTLNAHLDGEEARKNAVRVVVDAGNYRARRQSSLEQTARGAASKARREGRMVRLEPMPAHERRLVHMFLQTECDIVTQSEGREPMRRIVVSPATASGSMDSPSAPRLQRSTDSGSGARNGVNRGGMGSFRRGDAQSERNRGLQRGR